ncbi:MAG: hypothetical protein ACR2O4_15200 [Hyphomicrobiaceae bacterium]
MTDKIDENSAGGREALRRLMKSNLSLWPAARITFGGDIMDADTRAGQRRENVRSAADEDLLRNITEILRQYHVDELDEPIPQGILALLEEVGFDVKRGHRVLH